MQPEDTQRQNEGKRGKLLAFLIAGIVFVLLAAGIFYLVVVRGNGSIGEGIRSVLPFGNEPDDAAGTDAEQGEGRLGDVELTDSEKKGDRMFLISEGPVSGSGFKTLPDGSLVVRYVMREDGDIYEFNLSQRSNTLLANNTIPRVAEAVWDALGQTVVLRTATAQGNVESILGKLIPNPAAASGDQAPASLDTSFLAENIPFIVPGPVEGYVYAQHIGSDIAIAELSSSGQATTLYTSPFTEWIPEWPAPGAVTLTTRPSGKVGGYLFTLNMNSGSVIPAINDYPGLTTHAAPDGSHILIGGSRGGQLSFGVLTKADSKTIEIYPSTLPEKCAWTASSSSVYCGVPQSPPSGVYPDEWYQGARSFSDSIWKYDLTLGQFLPFLTPETEVGKSVDTTLPAVSADDSYLTFIDKKTGSLWGIDLRTPVPQTQTP